jgi:hypothetical protein
MATTINNEVQRGTLHPHLLMKKALALVVAMVALGSTSMICLPLSDFDSELELASDSEAFTSATNNFFERKSTMLCQGLLWKSHHFLISFFVFSVSFACSLDWFS